MRAVIYARYSSDLQRDASIDDQVRICRLRAQKEGWDVVDIFTDPAISGSTLLRPGYQAMVACLRSGGAGIVVAESLDRFSRDQEHIAGFFKQASHAGVRIVTLAEGEVSELHIGLKGTMGALYLKDLAAKTHRGLEGRVRAGRFIGKPPYGYRMVRRLATNGEPERGLREIDPEKAVVVRRIFTDYAAGRSPRSIARQLNTEGVPGPTGKTWSDTAIRGRGPQEHGILRNQLYVGRHLWNRMRGSTDPMNGQRVRRTNPDTAVVTHQVPDLAIIDEALWLQVQERLDRESTKVRNAEAGSTSLRICDSRRPVHLLSGKVFCGCCGRSLKSVGKDYLACRSASIAACANTSWVRRPKLEAQVLDALQRQLMRPDLVETFINGMRAAWQQESSRSVGNVGQIQKDLHNVERQITNLIDALAEGTRFPDLQQRLDTLQTRRSELRARTAQPAVVLPIIPDTLAKIYRDTVADLKASLTGPEHTEALETARSLIDRVIVNPGDDPKGPPDIELVGDLFSMLKASGLKPNTMAHGEDSPYVSSMFDSSIKEGLRA